MDDPEICPLTRDMFCTCVMKPSPAAIRGGESSAAFQPNPSSSAPGEGNSASTTAKSIRLSSSNGGGRIGTRFQTTTSKPGSVLPDNALNEDFRAQTGMPVDWAAYPDATEEHWLWDRTDLSQEVVLYGDESRTAMFHPGWSNGTAGLRGRKRLNGTRSYWEIQVSHRVFGTSIMFGLASARTPTFITGFCHLLGCSNRESVGLSHKGDVWSEAGTVSRQFTAPFVENTPTKIGLLFDGFQGTLQYFKDGVNLGVAFRGLDKVSHDLYPMVSSTAARSEVRLGLRVNLGLPSLETMCLYRILNSIVPRFGEDQIQQLRSLPPSMRSLLLAKYKSQQNESGGEFSMEIDDNNPPPPAPPQPVRPKTDLD